MTFNGMADTPQTGNPAFSSWLAQISDAFSSGFRRLGQNETVDSVKDESSEVNLRVVHGSVVDSQGDKFDYALSAERLTPISEETDELESGRSLLTSDTGKMMVSCTEKNVSFDLLYAFLR